MKHAVVLSLMAAGLLAACARDCTALVEQHCRNVPLATADCQALAASAAKVPAQACEAVLQALESRGSDR